MRKILPILLILSSLVWQEASAQIYSLGNDPGSVKWRQTTSSNFRVIYPSGMDSLARQYALTLEKFRNRVGATIGYRPNESYSRPMPVILHPFFASSNGVVTWAPRRMELFTVPDESMPLPIPGINQLVSHESRHVSQMQFSAGKPYRWINCLVGELWPGAMSALYPGPAFLEGDAVVAETELNPYGRGHSSTFLNYYDICFSEGDNRDYWKWRWGSQKNYTPDHYRAGYFTIGGIRAYYDDPDFTSRYFRNIVTGWPLPLLNLQKTIKEASGKSFKATFDELVSFQKEEWEKDAAQRAPFMKMEKITEDTRLYSRFKETAACADGFYSIRSGLDRCSELVFVNSNGEVCRIAPFSSSASGLNYDASSGRLYWNEIIRDIRWELKASSVIRYLDRDGKIRNLSKRGKKYYNPCACNGRVAVAEYPDCGGSSVVILDADNGDVTTRLPAPDGMQVVEFCWLKDSLYFSAVTSEGFGLYDSSFNPVLAPARVPIGKLFQKDEKIWFTSDRNGSTELYSLTPKDGTVRQMTSTRFGADHFCFIGDSLFFLSGTKDSYGAYRTAASDLPSKVVDFYDLRYPFVAETLSKQASEIHTEEPDTTIISDTKYSKIAHLFKVHSWYPVYFKPDAVSNLSMETLMSDAGLGATALFHNDLNTVTGYVGWSAWNKNSGWRSSLHGMISYSGWYPVLELSFDINDRNASETYPSIGTRNFTKYKTFVSSKLGMTYAQGKIKAYLPLNFSFGGWNRGIIPQIQYILSNDMFSNGSQVFPVQTLTTSVRAYSIRPVASSCIYPRFGIGAEIGYTTHPMIRELTYSTTYGFLYGYLPGIIRTHGIKWSLYYEKQKNRALTSKISYALPFAPVDWSFLCPVTYIRNFEFTANIISQQCFTDRTQNSFNLRGDLAARLGNLLWIPYTSRIGVSVNWNTMTGKAWAGLLFSVDM